MPNVTWTASLMPDLVGRTAIVTGANAGLGLETATQLAAHGAHVILACRDKTKAETAAAQIRSGVPDAALEVAELDLASRKSIDTFAERIQSAHPTIDYLINNAGVMMCPEGKTEDGFETQFGTNHLGHFVLTSHLLPALEKSENGRIVVLSSLAHRQGTIAFDNLNAERGYKTGAVYGQSKLANLLFAKELARRLTKVGSRVTVTAAHPGWTATELQRHNGVFRFLNIFFAQKPERGALPTLYAATSPDAHHGGYYGPNGFQELNGFPAIAIESKEARDEKVASDLWRASEELTGISFLSGTA